MCWFGGGDLRRSGRVLGGAQPLPLGFGPPLDGPKAGEVVGMKRAEEMRAKVNRQRIGAQELAPEWLMSKGAADESLSPGPTAAALAVRPQLLPVRGISPRRYAFRQWPGAGAIARGRDTHLETLVGT